MSKTDLQQDLFIEQAEYIEPREFEQWTVQHPDEQVILKKLCQSGAKLITGPRGCGKTTLLLKAFSRLLSDSSERTLPVYVNFKASLRLEPLYKQQANAGQLFGQWLIYKTYEGLFDVLAKGEHMPPSGLAVDPKRAKAAIERLEALGGVRACPDDEVVSHRQLADDIAQVLETLGKTRCILLLDDAAHAFSMEQQRDFFEFFRAIKSKTVSPKAAIYPGVTIYSPAFHVGHDAEEIDVWIRPDSPGYLTFMQHMLEKRLPEKVYEGLQWNQPLLSLISYSAFGLPRALLNTVRSFYKGGEDAEYQELELDFSRKSALRSIHGSLENTMALFGSLSQKLPMYDRFIAAGKQVFERSVAAVKEYNRAKPLAQQSVTVAIRKPVPTELAKVLGFFQYAGLVLPRGEVSRGEKGVFELYVLHYAALIDKNALLVRKAVNVEDYVEALQRRHANEFTRVTPKGLLGTDNPSSVLALSLPPCQVCKTPRANENAKFCLNCGAQLKAMSVFEALVNNDISELPLTPRRAATIKQQSQIRTVKDILMDQEHRQLRSVPRVGPYWAKRIYSYAEEYIA
jgi:hypothetical protein